MGLVRFYIGQSGRSKLLIMYMTLCTDCTVIVGSQIMAIVIMVCVYGMTDLAGAIISTVPIGKGIRAGTGSEYYGLRATIRGSNDMSN